MRHRSCNQLMLDLNFGASQRPAIPALEELLNALAELLLEALGNQNNAIAAEREARDASQDHA
jgi:hypothetical protein